MTKKKLILKNGEEKAKLLEIPETVVRSYAKDYQHSCVQFHVR